MSDLKPENRALILATLPWKASDVDCPYIAMPSTALNKLLDAAREEGRRKSLMFVAPGENADEYERLVREAHIRMNDELMHEDLCHLSRKFGEVADWRNDRDKRINERLKALISAAQAPRHPKPSQEAVERVREMALCLEQGRVLIRTAREYAADLRALLASVSGDRG